MKTKFARLITLLALCVTMVMAFVGCGEVYSISFVDYDGAEIKTISVDEGAAVAYSGDEPTRDADAEYTYTFAGWMDENGTVLDSFPNATANATYTAKYNSVKNSYNVIFKNGDETLYEETLEYGTAVVYGGTTPEKAATVQYTYTFAGWTDGTDTYGADEIPALTGNATYTAVFTETVNAYQITWSVEGQTSTTTVNYGAQAAFDGTPEKAATAQYSYAFAGWALTEGGEVVDDLTVTGAQTYYAVFTPSVNSYKISFVGEDNAEITSVTLAYGAVPTFEGTTPEKAATAQYTYTFAGWTDGEETYTGALPAVTGVQTYKVVFTPTVNSYQITWNIDGQTSSTSVNYGEVALYGSVPTKEADAQYTYTFAGWAETANGDVLETNQMTVTGAKTYYAVFTTETNVYLIKFVDEDGTTVLDSQTLAYGSALTYKGAEPSKEQTVSSVFEFQVWLDVSDNSQHDYNILPSVTGEKTYKAVYQEYARPYQVTWMVDGSESRWSQVSYNTQATWAGAVPTKEADAQYTYTFAGWSKTEGGAIVPSNEMIVLGEVTYYAIFSTETNVYTVQFFAEDGETVLDTQALAYGTVPTYQGTTALEKEATAQYSYTFAGWTCEDVDYSAQDALPEVTGNMSFTIRFTSTLNEYTVTWVVNGAQTQETYKYGEIPSFKGSTEKEPTVETVYTFRAWADANENEYTSFEDYYVSGNVTYTAVYNESVRQFTVTWMSNGEVYETTSVNGNTAPVAPVNSGMVTQQYTYTFLGWAAAEDSDEIIDLAEQKIADTTTYWAVYSVTTNKYEIVFENNTIELQKTEVEYGTVPVYAGEEPTQAGDAQYSFVFSGWKNATTGVEYAKDELPTVTDTTVYIAVFEQVVNQYTVTVNYVYRDGGATAAESKTLKADYGTLYGRRQVGDELVTDFESPTVEGYLPSLYWVAGRIEEDVTVTVTYSAASVWDGTSASESLSGAGTELDPYLIQSAADLAFLSNDSNGVDQYGAGKYYKLTTSIDLAGHNWTSICRTPGTDYTWKNFSGHFDGDGYTIGGLYHSNASNMGVALFCGIDAGSVTNLTIEGSFTGRNRVAGLAYMVKANSSFSNINGFVNVNNGQASAADSWSGGLLGTVAENSTITNCNNYGTVSGNANYVGGVVGKVVTTTVTNCNNYGLISMTGNNVGGVVGTSETSSAIKNSHNYGLISMTTGKYVGGIVGGATSSEIDLCTNHGVVSGTTDLQRAAGIAGQGKSTTVTNCINYADISGVLHNGGGIVGFANAAVAISMCKNYGDISGFSMTTGSSFGGIVAQMYSTSGNANSVDNCTNYGTVTAYTYVAGIAGNVKNTAIGTVTNCVNYGDVVAVAELTKAANQWVGGVVGYTNYQVTGCTNYGNVTASGTAIGGVVGWASGATSLVDNCFNYGNVTAVGDFEEQVGGICGYSSGTVSNCENNGAVLADDQVGGICGSTNDAIITECTNNGDVTGANYSFGGIIGNMTSESSMSGCENYGNISGGSQVGGLIGYAGAATDIANAGENFGEVSGNSNTGDIVGRHNVTT